MGVDDERVAVLLQEMGPLQLSLIAAEAKSSRVGEVLRKDNVRLESGVVPAGGDQWHTCRRSYRVTRQEASVDPTGELLEKIKMRRLLCLRDLLKDIEALFVATAGPVTEPSAWLTVILRGQWLLERVQQRPFQPFVMQVDMTATLAFVRAQERRRVMAAEQGVKV